MATRVMLVDESQDRAAWLGDALNEAGYEVVGAVQSNEDLYQQVLDIQPDVVIIEARSGRRDILEGLGTRKSPYPKPVVLFTEHNDPELMRAATGAGVSPYVVSGLSSEGVRSIINVAINQFQQYEQLRHELVDARTRLEHQRHMEQAKCFLMERDGIGENDAYHLLRRTAMERGRPISDIARAFLRANNLV